MPDETIPLDRTRAEAVLHHVVRRLPPDWQLMPIGALGMMQTLTDPAQRTKDVDLVPFLVVDGKHRVPPTNALVEFAKTLSPSAEAEKDQTNVTLFLNLEGGRVKVELIRGRNPASGGYFVTRRLLEACASISAVKGRLLELPAEGLAVLKAWAATDQDKLVATGRDARGFHAARAAAFRLDVSRLARSLLDTGKKPTLKPVAELLKACPPTRRQSIEVILKSAGWTR